MIWLKMNKIYFALLITSCYLDPNNDLKSENVSYNTKQPYKSLILNCPSDMVEVKGDYCFSLEHKCLKWREKEQKACLIFEENYAKCNGKTKPMHFCVDKYEIPNVYGQKPMLGMSFYDVKSFCEKQNKRMGTDQEWTLAAEGPSRKPYPFGWTREPDACNWDKKWIKPNETELYFSGERRQKELLRLDQSVNSGSHSGCVSDYGVYDMTANADEWTLNVTLGGKPYIGLLKGGYWAKGIRNRNRPHTEAHGPDFNGYEVGGRCFKDLK